MRGGVVITFEVTELPLIEQVNFDGLRQVDQLSILNAFVKEHVEIRKGAPLDPVRARSAIQVVKEVLASRGWVSAKVELRVQNVTATTVSLTFVISSE